MNLSDVTSDSGTSAHAPLIHAPEVLNLAAARMMRDLLCTLPPAVVDFSHSVFLDDAALALVLVNGGAPRPFDVRGLGRHQLRLLEYLGVSLELHGGRHPEDDLH